MPIELSGQVFVSEKKAQDFVRSHFINFDPDDPLWKELLDRHTQKQEKIGAGVKSFFVTLNGNKAFQLNILRVDGSVIDISWRHCIKPKHGNERHLKDAMRHAISPQTQGFKNGLDVLKCEICLEVINDRTKAHVDHFPQSFKELYDKFLSFHKTPPLFFSNCPSTCAAIFKDEDQAFKKEWQAFHGERCHFRLLCQKCHLTRKG